MIVSGLYGCPQIPTQLKLQLKFAYAEIAHQVLMASSVDIPGKIAD